MHIPDGFLSTPVWAALDAVAIPTVGLLGRKAQQGIEDARLPLMGVMGAFVFAAQIINFPVGVGTSGHLVGGALLAMTLGPATASIVMTAILGIQALVFQDGGILALGANVLNMAIFGVWAGYLPYRIWNGRAFSVIAGGFLSVFVSAMLALAELRLSGIAMPPAVLGVSIGLFAVSALLEGIITLAVVNALQKMGTRYVRAPQQTSTRAYAAIALAAILLVTVGVLVASTNPDGIDKLAQDAGILNNAKTLLTTPFADYEIASISSPWFRKAGAGLAGLVVIYIVVTSITRVLLKRPIIARAPVSGD
jgi:cobalt/nickel transport system permease protein